MARGPRLDAPVTLHHVMVRGIERRQIFEKDRDRENFLGAWARSFKREGREGLVLNGFTSASAFQANPRDGLHERRKTWGQSTDKKGQILF